MLQITNFHTAVFALPLVVGGATNALATTQLFTTAPIFIGLQDLGNLFRTKFTLFHFPLFYNLKLIIFYTFKSYSFRRSLPSYHTSIQLPEGNIFTNDIVINNHWAYISVTNTGKIFKLNLENPTRLTGSDLSEYVTITGANGLVTDGKTLYIAFYPADGNTTPENVLYKISNIENPIVGKLVTAPGQYDGLALENSRLYFSNWVNSEIGYINLSNNTVTVLPIKNAKITGPADISILNHQLYIPNLSSSEIVMVNTQNL